MQEDRDLAARLDLLMDHLEENREKGEDARKAQILSDLIDGGGVGEGGGDPDAKKDFLRCIGLLKTNALEVQMGKARALFPTFSFLSHSCLNNASTSNIIEIPFKKGRKTDPSLINIVRHVTERIDDDGNFQIKVFSQRQIDQGEEVTITYINLLRSTMERNAKLEYAWHFRCQCLRCQDPHELGTNIGSIKCPKCQNVMTTDLPNQRYQCCGNFPYVVVDRMLTQFMEILTSVTSMWNMEVSSVIENLDDYLKRTETVLHSNHYLRLLAKRYLTQLLEDDCPRKKQLCQELLEMFSILDPGLSHSRGITLCELFKTTKDVKMVEEIKNCLHMELPDSVAGKAYTQAKRYCLGLNYIFVEDEK